MANFKKSIKKRNSKAVTVLLFSVVLILFILQIVFANSLSSKGKEILKLEDDKQELLRMQSTLSGTLAVLGSLDRVRDDARKIGMIESSENFDYLVPPRVAYNP